MKKPVVFLIISILPVFILIYYIFQYLTGILQVDNIDFAYKFYKFLTFVSAFMLLNVLIVYFAKQQFVGYTFLIWSMLKIMLVMAFFIIFVLHPKLPVSNSVVFDIMILYALYLIYEVVFGIVLLKEKNSHLNSKSFSNK